MKTKEISIKEKTFVEQMRAIRDKTNHDIQDMTLQELKEYFSKQKTLHSASVWK